MLRVKVADGFFLDEEMFELSLAKLGQCAPEKVEEFTWEEFTRREGWMLIPDVARPDLPFFRAERRIKVEPPYSHTVKLNVWYAPDLRLSGAPMPHNHPWEEFDGQVFMGGYIEDRWEVPGFGDEYYESGTYDEVIVTTGVAHLAGNANNIPIRTFHEVKEIIGEPGRTLSMMDCGPGLKDAWGYLDPDTGRYTHNKKSPTDERFDVLFYDRNPHLR